MTQVMLIVLPASRYISAGPSIVATGTARKQELNYLAVWR